jgi:hypothetical protein
MKRFKIVTRKCGKSGVLCYGKANGNGNPNEVAFGDPDAFKTWRGYPVKGAWIDEANLTKKQYAQMQRMLNKAKKERDDACGIPAYCYGTTPAAAKTFSGLQSIMQAFADKMVEALIAWNTATTTAKKPTRKGKK